MRYIHDPMVSFAESLERCRLERKRELRAVGLAEEGEPSTDTCGPFGPPCYPLKPVGGSEDTEENQVTRMADD